jgi:hypothetical protein
VVRVEHRRWLHRHHAAKDTLPQIAFLQVAPRKVFPGRSCYQEASQRD